MSEGIAVPASLFLIAYQSVSFRYALLSAFVAFCLAAASASVSTTTELPSNLRQHIPAFNMGNKVIETTGAGDAFNGGFAYALAEGIPLTEAVRYGSATAAISVTRLGTAPAMPYKEEIQKLLDS